MIHKRKREVAKSNPAKTVRLSEFISRGEQGYQQVRPYAFGKPLRVTQARFHWFVFAKHVHTRVVAIKNTRKDRANSDAKNRERCQNELREAMRKQHKAVMVIYDRKLQTIPTWILYIARIRARVIEYQIRAEAMMLADKTVCFKCSGRRQERYIEECTKCSNGWGCGSRSTTTGGDVFGNRCNPRWTHSCPQCYSEPGDTAWFRRKLIPKRPVSYGDRTIAGKMVGFPRLLVRLGWF